MEQEYSKDFFWDTYKKLPEDLKEALFSDKNNEVISHICSQAGLTEEQTASVAKFAGRVLMGLLPLDEFPITIELELNIGQGLASQINRQIYISILKHLRVSLNKINDANFAYVDSFTSEDDGKETIIRPQNPIIKQPSFPSKSITDFPKPHTNTTQKESPIKTQKLETSAAKNPLFSYNDNNTLKEIPNTEPQKVPAPEKPAVIETPATPSANVSAPEKPAEETKAVPVTEEQFPKQETKIPIPSSPTSNAPSRNAFFEELQKEKIEMPEIPVSLQINSIPTIAIDGIEGVQKDPNKKQEAPLTTNISKPPVINIPEMKTEPPKIPETKNPQSPQIPSLPKIPEKETGSDVPANPFADTKEDLINKDPYKEIPL